MRLFIAVELPYHEAFDRLHDDLKALGPGLKPVRPKDQHITVKFIGEPACKIEEIEDACVSTSADHSPFELKIGACGAFPNWHRPKVLWIGLEGGGRLKELASDLDTRLHAQCRTGREKRDFSAHITAARVKDSRNMDLVRTKRLMETCVDLLEGEGYSIPVERFHLVNSTLTPRGPVYERIGSFEMGNG